MKFPQSRAGHGFYLRDPKGVDDRKVASRWFSLENPDGDEKRMYRGRMHLRLCFDGGYHVMDEAAHVCSDYSPTARQLWKPPLGTVELGVIGCKNLIPVKTVNGKGCSDAYCVAKYGPKWVRTRTVCDSLEPKWNEQYTFKVYDPCTVLSIGVFDNSGSGFEIEGSKDATRPDFRIINVVAGFCRDPRWGRCYESYSEDPKIVQAMTEIIPGLQGEIPANCRKGVPFVAGNKKVAACAKHFVGDGGTTKGINENNTVINRHGLLSIHMPGYYNSIIKGVATIMVSYSSWNGVKMHANHDLVTAFLKNTLRFRGFVISDWEGIDRITSPPHANYSYSIQAGINAGIDMVMVPYNYMEFIDGLTFLVKNKIIPMSRIDDAVKRILRVKFVMGLFEEPFADMSLVHQLGSQEHRELAREVVRRSLVLLKNGESAEKPLIPLPKKTSKILVAGSHADNLGYQCGGWTIEWQGLSGNNLTEGTTILTAIKNTSNNISYAIVVVGEHPYAETFGDSLNLTIPDPGPTTITNVCGAVKCVVIVISGRPVVVQPYVASINALVAAWLPGTEGQGVADVLFGDYGFTGKLSRTWFKTVDQLPMNVGDARYDPLFPFGFGLTTTPTHFN
ncbi:hypothetical protein PRUPE_7G007600 [Prunus persica]|uniref:C2 domain-containing protein n=1 Tax=Prunus persica TaxID=3760 RepID=A0A251N4L0_PRUPE|nr:hypothetical protein PRUPE_7G007600 [Prunus persica]